MNQDRQSIRSGMGRSTPDQIFVQGHALAARRDCPVVHGGPVAGGGRGGPGVTGSESSIPTATIPAC